MTREELNQAKQQEIINEQRREKRKKSTIFFFKVSLVLILGFLIFYLYTTYISTSKLIVKEERIVDKDLPSNFDGLKVIQFSDLHYGTTVFYDELKNLVVEINKRNPDIVIFNGDLIDASYDLSTDEQEKISDSLKKIDASLGKYAVPGEEDDELFYTIMKQSDFNVLENSYDFIYNNDEKPILLIGLGSILNDSLNVSEGFAYFNETTHNSDIYTIVMSHEPDTVDKISAYRSDLYLAGHSHNGNVRLPIVGSLYKFDGAEKYIDEYYNLGNYKLYISSGVGTNGPGFRLFCRPSFNFFRISSK